MEKITTKKRRWKDGKIGKKESEKKKTKKILNDVKKNKKE